MKPRLAGQAPIGTSGTGGVLPARGIAGFPLSLIQDLDTRHERPASAFARGCGVGGWTAGRRGFSGRPHAWGHRLALPPREAPIPGNFPVTSGW